MTELNLNLAANYYEAQDRLLNDDGDNRDQFNETASVSVETPLEKSFLFTLLFSPQKVVFLVVAELIFLYLIILSLSEYAITVIGHTFAHRIMNYTAQRLGLN